MEGYKIVEMTKDALEVECDSRNATKNDETEIRTMTEEENKVERALPCFIADDILNELKRHDLTCREAIDIVEMVKSRISYAAYCGKIAGEKE